VLAMAYRGYSGNLGRPSEGALKKDADAIIKFLNDTKSMDQSIASKIDTRLLYLYGRGLGGAVSTYMSTQAPTLFRGLILQNSFTSIPDYLRQTYAFTKYIPDKLILNKWNNTELISQIEMPMLFIITSDDLVPNSHTYKLKKLAKKAKFVDIYKMDDSKNLKSFISKLKQFIKETVLKYELEDFDDWSGGNKWKPGQKILHYENEKNTKVKITHTKLPKGAVKKLQEKRKAEKSSMADDLEKIRTKHKEEMADLSEEQLQEYLAKSDEDFEKIANQTKGLKEAA
jgi:hypothetical protein